MSSSDQNAEELKKAFFLQPLSSEEELRYWISVYLGIDLPFSNVSQYTEDQVSDVIYASPGQAIWEAYRVYKEDLYKTNPGYIWMANRDGAKTLAGSILNVLLICHFKAEIAHLAAVRKQAEKCIEYTNTFIKKIKPYLEHHGRKVIGDSKTKIQIENEDGSLSYIDVVIANLAGGNSQRSTVGSYDELDTLSKQGLQGYKESLLIPTRKNNKGPLRIKYSTRKFSFGVFEKEIQNRAGTGEKLVQWNILDIAEKCTEDRSLENLNEKHTRYVKRKLPLRLFSEEEFDAMSNSEKLEVRKITLHKGCLNCPIAPVCQGHLTKKQNWEKPGIGSVYKSIDFVIGQFKTTSSEMAEAQLLCWKPSSVGLVYPRFSEADKDNVISLDHAYELVTGDIGNGVRLDEFVSLLHSLEAKFYAGVDFGFTNHSVIVVMAVTKQGYSFILDSYSMPGMEAHEFAEVALGYQKKYQIHKWYCDQAAPANIKTLKKKLKSENVSVQLPEFKKDIQAGIDAIRSQIVTATGLRLLKVVNTPENQPVLTMFKEHHFLLDQLGNVTKNPDDTAGVADVGDALRYIGQNVFTTTPTKPIIGANTVVNKALIDAAQASPASTHVATQVNSELIKQEVAKRVSSSSYHTDDNNKKGKKLFWNTE